MCLELVAVFFVPVLELWLVLKHPRRHQIMLGRRRLRQTLLIRYCGEAKPAARRDAALTDDYAYRQAGTLDLRKMDRRLGGRLLQVWFAVKRCCGRTTQAGSGGSAGRSAVPRWTRGVETAELVENGDKLRGPRRRSCSRRWAEEPTWQRSYC